MRVPEHTDDSIERDLHDERVVDHIMSEVQDNSWKDFDFEERVVSVVSWLHDEGVEIGAFIGSSRRLVFGGKYKGFPVVIKLTAFIEDRNETGQQNQEEEIWHQAQKKGDESLFAKIYLTDHASSCVVQERCTDVESVEYEDLENSYQVIANEYGIRELELGRDVEGNLKFVDYGY
ncbi:hypothetical protein OAL67_00755 [bacterium]|nr:hypothetical protein [bacterium]